MVALNESNVARLSPLTLESLRALLVEAFRVRVVDDVRAMLVAFDERARYESPNFHWFASRHERFVYVDRVVVAESERGRGLARALYEDLIEAARREGHAVLCCEIYADPPNPISDAFHAALGFEEVGRAFLADRGKTVRYLVRGL